MSGRGSKQSKKESAEQRREAAVPKAKTLKVKPNNESKRRRRPAKQIFKDLTNKKPDEFSSSEEQEEDPNDLDYVADFPPTFHPILNPVNCIKSCLPVA